MAGVAGHVARNAKKCRQVGRWKVRRRPQPRVRVRQQAGARWHKLLQKMSVIQMKERQAVRQPKTAAAYVARQR